MGNKDRRRLRQGERGGEEETDTEQSKTEGEMVQEM